MRISPPCTLAILLAASLPGIVQGSFDELGSDYRQRVLPILDRYCFDCHDAESKEGELDLERFASIDAIRQEPEIWQKLVEQLEIGEMPPKKKRQPSAPERDGVLSWARGYLAAEARASAGDPGPVVLRRLNNAEYTYTVRDLTGVAGLDPAREFPGDSAAGEGFTNSGAALVMSPALLEKYLTAGKAIAAHAVLLPDGMRFSASDSRRDWAHEILGEIRQIYADKLGTGGIDFSYRKEVGEVEAGDGRLDYAKYLDVLIEHREALLSGVGVGTGHGLNAPYLDRLAKMLVHTPGEPSPLLDSVRQRWRTAPAGGGGAIAAEIRAWQDVLWRFNPVGHLGPLNKWQVPVTPIVARGDLRMKLEAPIGQGDIQLALASRGEGKLVWEMPRIVRPGSAPLLLRDVRAATLAAGRLQAATLANFAELAAIAFEARRSGVSPDPASLGVDALQLELVMSYLAGEADPLEYLSARIENVGGVAAAGGWGLAGVADLSMIGNGGGEPLRIPGELPPGRIVVHPRPERWIAASWQSPISGPVTVGAQVIDRHSNCGNGVAWKLRCAGRTIRSGAIDNGGQAAIEPVRELQVRPGDMVSLIVEARDGDHVCDLTEIELSVAGPGVGDSWSLSADCAGSISAGNPHADRHGNLAVWHFHTGVNDGKASAPVDPMIAEWQACTDAAAAAALAERIAARAAGDAHSTLFSGIDLAALAATVRPAELAETDAGIDSGLFDAEGNLRLVVPGELAFSLPPQLLDGAELVGTPRVEDGAAQVRLSAAAAAQTAELLPGIPVIASPGTAGEARMARAFDAFRELFPASMCYARVVPIDEVVTLTLYHREDEHLARLMLTETERERLDRLWDELRFVGQDAFQVVTGLEQILEFATQDSDPKIFDPLREPIAAAAAALEQRLLESEPAQLSALVAFAARAYRRPLGAGEEAGIRDLYEGLRAEGMAHDETFRLVLARVFASPNFLYKREAAPPGKAQAPVSDWELATRLSYFLWSSAPDEALWQAVEEGRLDVIAQSRRMLDHPNARRLAIEFACQWLHVRDFDRFDEKSESQFPEFAGLRAAMYEEVVQFFTDLIRSDASILSIFDADHLFVNPELAEFYGIAEVGDAGAGDGWRKLPGARAAGRGGILGMATTLAKQSGASRTSPILRGNWVSETLLGEYSPKPPKGIPPLPEIVPAGLSERAMIERHSSDAACAKCHARIDPYGFALEGFDAIGRRRGLGSDGAAIDTRTTVLDGTKIDGVEGLRDYLVNARRGAIVRQFCKKLLGYALGRSTRLSDDPLLDEMGMALEQGGYRFSIAVECIQRSRQFLEIRGADTN